MPFKNFTDSRGQQHTIYMQERAYSCSIACICTLLNLLNHSYTAESEIRLLSQQFEGGYRSAPVDINGRHPTFINTLQKFGIVSLFDSPIGTKSSAVSDVLAHFDLYSHLNALKELNECNQSNYKSKLKDKIVLLSAKTPTSRHSIIIRDVWDDGTIVVYDPENGLIETDDLTKQYDLNDHEIATMVTHCAFTVYQNDKLLDTSLTHSKIAAYSFNSK